MSRIKSDADKKSNPCPIYIISLPGTEARREGIRQQFEKLGLDFEFVDAIRGSELSQEERTKKVGSDVEVQKNINRTMNDGEIGCALSHQKVYDKILQEGHERAFVLEDDALLLPGFVDALRSAVEISGLELLIFGYPKLAQGDIDNVELYDPVLPLGQLAGGFYYGQRPRESHLGMVGYLVSREGCQKLKMNDPLITVADDHIIFSRSMKVWHLRPFAVAEDTVHVSTIRGDFRRNRHGLSLRQRISRTLRGLWRRVIIFQMRLSSTSH